MASPSRPHAVCCPKKRKREIERSTVISNLLRLRKLASRFLRLHYTRLRWLPDFRRRTLPLHDKFRGQRAILMANGPSLTKMDLALLDREFVCTVNMGLRAAQQFVPHVAMHVVTDNNRYRKFAGEIETISRDAGIPYRFLSTGLQRAWARQRSDAAKPHFVLLHNRSFLDRGPQTDLSKGICGGSTVLISAAQILFFLGFREVYIIGCDLDYESEGKYFYTMSARDNAHEADPAVMQRRLSMTRANAEFAIMRTFYERDGRKLFNAGLGGNLHALERCDLKQVLGGQVAMVQPNLRQ
jgi:hypothetical protein